MARSARQPLTSAAILIFLPAYTDLLMENVIIGLIALALFLYLCVALLRPEKF